MNTLSNNTVLRRYSWQPDSLALDVPLSVFDVSANASYCYATDANKNVSALTDANGNVVAHYEYSPFGQQTKVTGTYASSNPFRFSSEYFDVETGLVYYNYRYYDAKLGRWLSRDPIEESDGVNLYTFIKNNTVDKIDVNGLRDLKNDFPCISWSPARRIIINVPFYTVALRKDVSYKLLLEKEHQIRMAKRHALSRCNGDNKIVSGESSNPDFSPVSFMYWNKNSPFFISTFPLGQVLVKCPVKAICSCCCKSQECKCHASAKCPYSDPFDFDLFVCILDTYISFVGEWDE